MILKGRPELGCGSSWQRKLLILLQEVEALEYQSDMTMVIYLTCKELYGLQRVILWVVLAHCLGAYLGSFTFSVTLGST